jgi:ActR/RegA family two-component response regulator
MAQLKISKVTALPVTFDASTLYLVSDAVRTDDVNIYVSDSTGAAVKHVPTFAELGAMVDSKITAGLTAASSLKVVSDIAARDALAPTIATMALVLDATADVTVLSGAATYVYNPATTSWAKVSEHESLDVVLQWADIVGKPTSAVADIDDAVTKRHTHANIAVLDLLTSDGTLVFNGSPVAPQMLAEQW